ncbi:MBL fold metallo-hydrolase [Nocardiopsis dassonvillei]|uniref:MBL fold metallo-hydrolase n=1 Tax=Nocardiopsis dassonvillei TaxID=2014 RepID=UPI00362ACCD6
MRRPTAQDTVRDGTGPGAPLPGLREIADGVYVYEQLPGGWCLNNAGLIASGGQSALIDTAATEKRARHLGQETERVVPGGPDVVVNTHFHGDHVFGNSRFTPRATLIAHERTRSDMAKSGFGLCGLWPDVDWGDLDLALPDETFQGTMTIPIGGLAVELISVGPAHTRGDVVAWVPARKVLFTGDVAWSGVSPYILMGSLEGSLSTIKLLRELKPETVVCGHGPVGGPEVLDMTESYLHWVRQIARDGLRSGLPPLTAARTAKLGPFSDLVDPERLVGNLHRAYAEAEGIAPGEPVDVLTSFREMVDLNGGLPTCSA